MREVGRAFGPPSRREPLFRPHWPGIYIWLILVIAALCWAVVLTPIHLLGIL